MNRIDFCRLLVKAREKAEMSMYAIQRKANVTYIQVKRLETGDRNFSISDVFWYLDAVGHQMSVNNGEKSYALKCLSDFRKAFVEIRTSKKLSQAKACVKIEVSRGVITGIETRGDDTTIDKFLQCVYGLDCKIEITPK